jgi:3-methyladenine DNA glycosylase AlkD
VTIAAIVREIESRASRMPAPNTAALRTLRREYSKRLKALPPGDIVVIGAALIANRRIHRFVGDELIANHREAFATLDLAQLERLGSGMSSWDQVDCFACYLSGPAWREGLIGDAEIANWARSKDRWWRRAALVSTVPLNVKARGGKGDARRTLRICAMLLDDRDDMVVKALSWALRALAGCDPAAVQLFVKENESRLAPLVRREVRNKLATGLKNPKLARNRRAKHAL